MWDEGIDNKDAMLLHLIFFNHFLLEPAAYKTKKEMQ